MPTALKMSSPVLKPGFLCLSLRASSRRSSRRSGSLYSVPNLAALRGGAHAAAQAELACCRLPFANVKVADRVSKKKRRTMASGRPLLHNVSFKSKQSMPPNQHVSPKTPIFWLDLIKSRGDSLSTKKASQRGTAPLLVLLALLRQLAVLCGL